MEKLAFVTATWARTEGERALILETIKALGVFGFPIVVSDETRTDFIIREELLRLPFVDVVNTADADSFYIKRLRASRKAASISENIFWLESDKKGFVTNHLPSIISSLKLDREEVVVPYPDVASFSGYPPFQITIENCINQLMAGCGVPAMHFTYGPMLFPGRLISALPDEDEKFGWGISGFLALLAHHKHIPFRGIPISVSHDADVQMGEQLKRFRLEQLKEYIIAMQKASKLIEDEKS